MQTHVIPFENVCDLLAELNITHREVVGSREVVIGKLDDDPVAVALDLIDGSAVVL
jgi:hypothetical protein